MSRQPKFRALVLSMIKHDYIPRGLVNHPRFELAVVADDADQPDWVHERNAKFAEEFGIPYLKNVEQAIAEHDVQIAVISSAAERHCELSVRAAEAGLHVVQDKPMSNSLEQCDRVVDAVEKNNVRFLMWNRSFLPAINDAKVALDDGEIGNPFAIHIDFYFAKDAGPAIGTRNENDPPLNWLEALKLAHATGADGGVGKEPMGELSIEGCYPLGYISRLLNAKINRVFARTTSHFHQLYADNDVEDLATVTLEFENGILGSLAMGRIGNASHPDIGEIKLHILGSKGGLVISEARPEISIYHCDQPATEFKHHRLLAEENDFLLAENFANAIDSGEKTILDARESRDITAIVAAAIESGRTGQFVDVSYS